MTTTHQDFDLCLEKQAPNEFVAYVPVGEGDAEPLATVIDP